MRQITTPTQTTVSYEQYGSGSALVLVHGSFSDHETNWALIKPLIEPQFTVYAIARRGRGKTDATQNHSVEDESQDVAALVKSLDEAVFLLGHSYGGQVALGAAALVPGAIRKLVLYEPPWPHIIRRDTLNRLQELAQSGNWDALVTTFCREVIAMPVDELNDLRRTQFWSDMLADAKVSLGDIRALSRYDFDLDRLRDLQFPVRLQIGTESRRDLYVTDALASVLPQVRIEALPGQAHEGMNTAPDLYVESVSRFLLRSA
ncbi:alpha/beta fold hydrolase [Egbenema bharatensis]|uniref:alpha/beta fold hydrolase n=1 Tax=Egbenema bharatensis TaxID=3463334 RepID=UPI003A8B0ADA